MRVRGVFRTLAGLYTGFAGTRNEPMAAWVFLGCLGQETGHRFDSAGVRFYDAWKDAGDYSG